MLSHGPTTADMEPGSVRSSRVTFFGSLLLCLFCACAGSHRVAPVHQPIAACAAPTPEEVEAAKSELNDFVAIRFASDDLVATSMTPDELDAVAYFWVAADLQHRPERFDDTPSDWRHPGPESPERERL